jgi:hypothetical protein
VAYTIPPTKGETSSPDAANADLRGRLDAGMTLVVSYWSGEHKKDMGWLDAPCKQEEVEGWHCTDAWVEHPECARPDLTCLDLT